MYTTPLIALEILLIHIAGTYLRWLPFSPLFSKPQKHRLWHSYMLYAFAALLINFAILQIHGTSVHLYKLLLALGWIPFFLITFFSIRNRGLEHLFLLGMQSLYTFFLHSLSILLLILFDPGTPDKQIAVQAGCYLLLFSVLLPLSRKCFLELLPTRQSNNRKTFTYFSLLPLALVSSHISFLLNSQFYSWQEMFSRLLLLLCFFLFYRYVLLQKQGKQQQTQLRHESRLLTQQLNSLQDYTLLMQESQRQLSILRHDMRHNIRLLYTLLNENRLDEIQQLLEATDSKLSSTAIRPFCQNPIINAALSIYIHRALELQIPVTQKISLPAQLPAEENDLAILLSNLIENATIASLQQPPERREISLHLQTKGQQIVLCLENRFDTPLTLGEDGLPTTQAKGHGTGMISLSAFAQKYHAITQFNQENGWVQITMYWKTTAKTNIP